MFTFVVVIKSLPEKWLKKKKRKKERKKSYDQLRQHIKKQKHDFANKGPCRQSYVFH